MIDPYTLILDELDVGDAGFGYIDSTGLEDSADLDSDTSSRHGDGTHTGKQRLTSRTVSITLGHNMDTDEDAMQVLRTVLAPRTDRTSLRLAKVRHTEADPSLRFLYRPADGRYLSVPADDLWVSSIRFSKAITVRLFVPDPMLYADDSTPTSFTTNALHTIVNDGTVAASAAGHPDLGAWSWTITAGGAGCTYPHVTHADFTGERWILPEALTAGQTVTVDPARVTRVAGVVRHRVSGADGSPVATWPVLRPGDNAIQVGCVSGTLTATVTTRSTW